MSRRPYPIIPSRIIFSIIVAGVIMLSPVGIMLETERVFLKEHPFSMLCMVLYWFGCLFGGPLAMILCWSALRLIKRHPRLFRGQKLAYFTCGLVFASYVIPLLLQFLIRGYLVFWDHYLWLH